MNIKEIAFDPADHDVPRHLRPGRPRERSSSSGLDRERLALDVALDKAVEGRPFATLRSMYVTETNADVARVALRETHARAWREEPIMAFRQGEATDVWTGRTVPSLHNTSAPDIVFSRFRPAPPR